jgi:HSP20 family protein
MLDREMRLYVQLLSEEGREEPIGNGQAIPIDAYLADDELHIECEVPGVAKDQIHVRVESHLVVVEGTRGTSSACLIDPLISMRSHGNFLCRLVLGDRCDVDQINANLSDGVLTIAVPLVTSPVGRQVLVADGVRASNRIAAGGTDSDQEDRLLVSVT